MALKIDAGFERKLICAFINDMKNLANFRLQANSNFISESKMAALNQNKKIKTTRSTRCSAKTLFYPGNKRIAQLTKLFTYVLQNRCS